MMPTHRQLVYDPIESTRGFKRYMRKNCGNATYDAYLLGEFHALYRGKALAARRFPPGRRRSEYLRGFAHPDPYLNIPPSL